MMSAGIMVELLVERGLGLQLAKRYVTPLFCRTSQSHHCQVDFFFLQELLVHFSCTYIDFFFQAVLSNPQGCAFARRVA